MRKHKHIFSKLTILAILATSVVSIVYANWSTKQPGTATTQITTNPKEPVCYYYDANNYKKSFASIEAGVEAADNEDNSKAYEVIVIPGTTTSPKEITISRSFTINSNVSLILPYEEEKTDTTYLYRIVDDTDTFDANTTATLDSNVIQNNDTDVYSVFSNNMTLNVTVNTQVTITNNGILRIGGQQSGSNGGNMAGYTTTFAQLELKDGAKLICNKGSILSCFGYIKGNDIMPNDEDLTDNLSSTSNFTIELNNGSSTYLPFVLVEHRGGTVFLGLSSVKGSPFNRFYFPNISNAVILLKNSYIYSIPDLYAGSQHNRCCIKLIGTENDCLLQSSEFTMISYYQVYFNNTTYLNNKNYKPNHNLIFLNGDMLLNTLTLNVSVATLSTDNCYLPVSCYYSLKLVQGSLKSEKQKVKALYGSHITVDKNYKLDLLGLSVYGKGIMEKSSDGDETDAVISLEGKSSGIKYEETTQAQCILNGTLKAKFVSGYIQTTSSDALLQSTWIWDLLYEVDNSSSEFNQYISYAYLDYIYESDGNTSINKQYKINDNNMLSIENSGDYYFKLNNQFDITIIDLVEESLTYETNSGDAGTFNIITTIYPTNYSSTNFILSWSIVDKQNSSNNKTIEASTTETQTYTVDGNFALVTQDYGKKAKLTLKKNSDSSDKTFEISLTASFTNSNSEAKTIKSDSTLTFTAKKPSCILTTAKVMMANGEKKDAGEIKIGDEVLSFNHETGKYESTVVIGNNHSGIESQNLNVITLQFDNGVESNLVFEHGYFDLTTNKYEYIRNDNYKNFIGHSFVYIDENNNNQATKLTNVTIKEENVKVCSPISANNFDIIVDNLLTMPGSIYGLFNIFEYDHDTLAFDKEKMEADIAKYGLLDYSYFEKYFPKYIYDLLPAKYMGIAIGKGLISWEIIDKYFELFGDQLLLN